MNAYALSGFGCNCRNISGLSGATDYDQIKIGGQVYSAKEIIGKTIIAKVDTKIYSGVKGNPSVRGTIKAGQPLGVVYSYLRPDQADGRSWLMFEGSYNDFYYVPNEAASTTGLKEQGTLTLQEEVKKEQEELQKQNDPFLYYVKKIGIPLAFIVGGIVVIKVAAPKLIDKLVPQRKPALAGKK